MFTVIARVTCNEMVEA